MNQGSLINRVFSTLANRITLIRLVLIIPLWICAITRNHQILVYGLIIVFISDLLDGFLARVLDQCTEIGARMDSIADHIIFPSAIVWMLMFRRETLVSYSTLLIPAGSVYLIAIAIGMIKSRRFGGAHLFGSKPFGLFGYVYVTLTLMGIHNRPIFFCACFAWIYFSCETIIYHFRPGLLNNQLRSAAVGLLGVDINWKPISYFISSMETENARNTRENKARKSRV